MINERVYSFLRMDPFYHSADCEVLNLDMIFQFLDSRGKLLYNRYIIIIKKKLFYDAFVILKLPVVEVFVRFLKGRNIDEGNNC